MNIGNFYKAKISRLYYTFDYESVRLEKNDLVLSIDSDYLGYYAFYIPAQKKIIVLSNTVVETTSIFSTFFSEY